ncbi:hypothetical protein [Amycolatopsis sp. NPDC049159]|uniref:hypothetical protein n=1 Tax=Amycolatopsis sp. NPDC049159 TaxID=3157210 RepID=UPI0033FB1E8E
MSAFSHGAGGSGFIADLAASVGRGEVGLRSLATAAGTVGEAPAGFVRWLAETACDADSVRGIVARSYWHPNGFAKLVLHTSIDPEFKIRMHVWPASEAPRRGETNPHSHRWEFASTLIAGQGILMAEYLEVTEGGEPFTRHLYGTNPADPALLVADGATRLVDATAPGLSRGGVYACGTDIVHTAEPLGERLTATVVVQGPHRTSTTTVFRPPGETGDQPNRPLSAEDFRQLVSAVVTEVRECSSRC